MGDLYLIFFAVGLLIFVAIVAYSVLQKRQFKPTDKEQYVDPLFAELEQKKNQAVSPSDASAQIDVQSKKSRSGQQRPAVEVTDRNSASAISTNGSSFNNLAKGTDSSLAPSAEAKREKQKRPEGKIPSERHSKVQQVKNDGTKKPPSLNQDEHQRVGGSATSATIHKAELAPKPKIDEDSASVVTELVARIKNPDPIEQQGLLALFREHDFKFHRKVHIYGLNQLTDLWRDIEFELPSARFTELGVSIQLADREGAMSQKELHDFQQMVLDFTNFYDAPFEFSMQIDEALKQALALDQIGRRYDSMAVLNVVPKSRSGFRMADIESCARDLMMSTDKNGIFMKTLGTKNNISVLFRLACTDGSGQFGISSGTSMPVHDLVVYMNVPATKDPEMVFQEMVKDANSLATWLEGKVVDRNGRIMTQRSYSMLMQQISDIAFSMQQDGCTPGDAVAKKLF
jgi:FtsZ-interacting cell division protein ZipA